MINERLLPRALIIFALIALGAGLAAFCLGKTSRTWIIGTMPVIVVLCASITRDLLAGRGWGLMPSHSSPWAPRLSLAPLARLSWYGPESEYEAAAVTQRNLRP